MKTTTETIQEMLMTSTWAAMWDSGDAYGRNWEKNQKNDPSRLPPIEIEVDETDIIYTINVFHYLNSQDWSFDEICHEFNAMDCDNWDSDYYGVSKEQQEFLEQHDLEKTFDFNTYNHDSHLSQVLQGTYIKINGFDYVLLQVHQGCDVRGGYTDAKLFAFDRSQEYMTGEGVHGDVTIEWKTYRVDNWYDEYSLTEEENSTPIYDIIEKTWKPFNEAVQEINLHL